MTSIQLTPDFKDKIQELKNTFDFLLSGNNDPEQGIYPVIVNGEIKGVRLGKHEPKAEGSACFIAGTHQNELIGWQAFRDVLDKWTGENGQPALKNAGLDGDIYLIFGGQKERVGQLFNEMLAPENPGMSIEHNTDFRERLEPDGSRANANRVRQDMKAEGRYHELNIADKKLIEDQDGLEAEVFSKCSLVLDLHSMSQAADPVLLPHTSKSLFAHCNASDHDRILRNSAKKWQDFCKNIGAVDVFPDLTLHQHGNPFAGMENGERNFRAVFEGGGPHNDPNIWEKGVKAINGALYTLWPEKLKHLEPVEITTPRIYGRMTHFYLPDSPNAEQHMPESAILCHDAIGEKWHLLTDGNIPAPVIAKIRELCGEEHAQLEHGRLATGKEIPKGAPIAYAYNAQNNAISLLVAPETGYTTMFPAAAANLEPKREESVGGIAPLLHMNRGMNKPRNTPWTNAANNNTPPAESARII